MDYHSCCCMLFVYQNNANPSVLVSQTNRDSRSASMPFQLAVTEEGGMHKLFLHLWSGVEVATPYYTPSLVLVTGQ